MDQPDLRLPLYQRLRDEIVQSIAAKVWRPGEPIPTEAELAASHGIAVGTVRKALDTLVADGLIERRQGRGTFVRRPNFDSSLFRFFRHHGLNGTQTVPEGRILSRKVMAAPGVVRDALRLRSGDKVIRMSRLRLVAGRAVLSEEIWLPHRRFARFLDAAPGEVGDLLYPAYERLCGELVARAEETLTIGTATESDIKLLGLAPGEPVVIIDRLAFDYDDKPIEWRRTHGLASAFRYHIDIR